MHAADPFAGLDAIYTRLRPAHARARKPAELEPDAPARMRQMWEATGVSEATGALRTRAQSEAELAELFKGWAAAPVNRKAWGPDAAAFRRGVPERVRVLKTGTGGVFLSDETGTEDDPPVLLMKPDQGRLLRYHDRYTEWQIWRGLGLAASIREAQHYPPGVPDGQQILKEAYPPGLYAMGDGIWWLHMPALSPQADRPVNSRPVLYASARHYLEFLLGLPVEKQGQFTVPKSAVFEIVKPEPINLAKGAPPGFRVASQADARRQATGWFQAIGPVGDTLVWLLMREKSDLMVGFDPAARDQVRAWLTSQGLEVTREQPLKQPKGADTNPGLSGW